MNEENHKTYRRFLGMIFSGEAWPAFMPVMQRLATAKLSKK
jgi:hypothetical protein